MAYDPTSNVIAHRLVLALLKWLQRRVRFHADSGPGGWRVLRYHRQSEVLTWFAAGFFGPMIIMCWVFEVPVELRAGGTIVFGGMLALSLVSVRLYRRCTLSYSDLGLEYVPLFAKPFGFGWGEIVQVQVSGNEQSCQIQLSDGRKARLSSWMNGYGQFLDDVRRMTN